MSVRSYLAVSLSFPAVLCTIALPRAGATDRQPNGAIGYACQQGCNNTNGCSWPFGKYTVWHPHVECRMTIGMVTCRDSEQQAPCYTQYVYENANCTGQLVDTIEKATPNCVPL